MAHAQLLRQALLDSADQPLLLLHDERNINADGRWKDAPGTVATGRQLLEEAEALLHGLGVHGVLRAPTNATLLVVYGAQHTMRYRTLLIAAALGNLHALFLPLYHNLAQALGRLLRRQWPAGGAQPRVAVLQQYGCRSKSKQ